MNASDSLPRGAVRLSPSRGEWAAAALATAVLGALALGPWPPSWRAFWSLFFLAESPWPVRLLLVLAPLVLLAILHGRLAAGTLRLAASGERAGRALPLLLFAVSFALFWVFREQRHWGDAAYTVSILEGTADAPALGRYFWKEPLDRLLAVAFAALGQQLGLDTESSVALLSALAGSLFVVVLWSASARLARQPAARAFVFVFTLAGGLSQLFFGHVENYTLVTLAMLLFLREGLAVAQGGGSLARAGLLAAVALTTHPLAGFLVVPLVALAFVEPPTPSDGEASPDGILRRLAGFAAAMLPGILYLAAFYALCRGLGAPPLELGPNRFGENESVFLGLREALAPRHLWDVLQNYLLVLPAGTAVVLLQLPRAAARSRSPRDRALLLLACASVSLLAFALCLRGTLRRRRDWDLFAPAALPVALFASRLFARRMEAGRASVGLGVFLVLFSLAVSGAWVASNYRYRPAAPRVADAVRSTMEGRR